MEIPRKGDVVWKGAIAGPRPARHQRQGLSEAPVAADVEIGNGELGRSVEPLHEHRRVHLRLPVRARSGRSTCSSATHSEKGAVVCTGAVTVEISGSKCAEPRADRVARAHVLRDPQRGPRDASDGPAMKGHPIRGFIAGLLLGICPRPRPVPRRRREARQRDARRSCRSCASSSAFLLGLWAPIGRRHKPKEGVRPNTQPLPAPVAWPESAPIEGSSPPPGAWKAPPGADRPTTASDAAAAPPADPVPPSAPRPRSAVTVDLTARRLHAGMRRWTSTTHPKKPPGAPSAARGSKPTPRRSTGAPTATRHDVRARRRRLPRTRASAGRR